MRPLLADNPSFHHWHHAAEGAAIDKNFAVHTPIWDWLFGNLYLPDRWPNAYGFCGGSDVPKGWFRQFLYPLWRRGRTSANVSGVGGDAKCKET
jgi:sterol desaturase/sphingolipid hydroxylase (fatty acid hydroxylase superfamily)